MLRVLDSEHGRLAHLVVDRVRRVHGLGHRQSRRGARRHEGLERDRDHGGEQRRDGARYGDGGDDFARRMLRLHKLTMSLTRDDGSDKWVEASPIEDLEEAA